jgi:hypothetical protein
MVEEILTDAYAGLNLHAPVQRDAEQLFSQDGLDAFALEPFPPLLFRPPGGIAAAMQGM